MTSVTFDHVSKVYPDGTPAVRALDLDVGDGEFLVLVGPSGCGKTTALRMVAGLEDISSGELRIGERVVNDLPAKDRDIAMVFQSYALYPHLTVFDNIAFGLRLQRVPKDEIRTRVEQAARVLGLTDYLKRKPRALSGGQRQRVAMGRAIVRRPQVFLMDEPLSNLDAKLRVQTRAEISRLQRDLEVTTIYVTHDQVEAMTMGDRVAVMRSGVLQQVAPPQELYDRPRNLFVAAFIGSPAMNLLQGRLERRDGGLLIDLGGQRLALDDEVLRLRPALAAFEGGEVIVGIRPEDVEDAALVPDSLADRRLRGRITLREALGSELLVYVETDARAAEVSAEDRGHDPGEHLGPGAMARPDGASPDGAGAPTGATFVGRLSPRSGVKEGDLLEMAVDTRAMHFFDPASGEGVYSETVVREVVA